MMMNKQDTMNNNVLLSIIVVVGILFAILATGIGSYVSAYNYGNKAENQIKAEYEDMENILGQYSLKVKEAAQVPALAKDDLKEVMIAAFSGRYGADGSKAVFQMINEQYPGKVDSALYKSIQQIIEAGRNKFENSQTRFIDIKRDYNENLGTLYRGFWMRMAGYPKIDMNKYVIISSTHAKDAFETKIDQGIKLK